MKKREEYPYPLNVLIDISDYDEPKMLDAEALRELCDAKWVLPMFEVVIITFLNDLEQDVIRLYYRELMTAQMIGDKYSVTRAWISHIKNKALEKLRQPEIFTLMITSLERQIEKSARINKSYYECGRNDGEAEASKKFYEEGYRKGYDDCRNARISEFTISIDDLPDIPVEDLCLSIRTYNLLKRSEINTLKQLVSYSPARLLSLKNMGQKTYEECVAMIRSFGIDTSLYNSQK